MNQSTETLAGDGHPAEGPYWARSRRPLAILIFLLPFVLFYELSLLLIPMSSGRLDIVAYQGIERIFGTLFGVVGLADAGMAIPAILLVVCLLAWHVMARHPWRLDGPTVPLMWLESSLVAVPVVVLGFVISLTPAMNTVGEEIAGMAPEAHPGILSLLSMAVGAGLYEELIFRWVLIAMVHTLLADLLKFSNRTAIVSAVLLSSFLFTYAHHPGDLGAVAFYFLAGLWFSALYLIRGFGIAAGGHIAYDLVWVTWNLPQGG